MIDTENLRTASLYINNQLLSRGLLRDGQSIDFARTGTNDEQDAKVAGQIISIVNDLILRRDRDAEHRESLSTAMSSLRAENLKLTADVARMTEKCADSQRMADLATAAETAMRTQLKSAEVNIKVLKDDTTRLKSLVYQNRASCANEIRRRDRHIDTLKKQVVEAGRSRGSRGNPAITTITVTGAVSQDDRFSMRTSNSLENETNAMFAQMAHHLTEENDAMLTMIQQTMAQLKDMSGWSSHEELGEDALVQKRPTCEDLAVEQNSVMTHMRTLLTNPSFVPIEEVVVREEEINRLKSGWIKMESRWKDAVHLLDGWRKRMATSGKPVCDAELQMGIRLSPVRVNDVEETCGEGTVSNTLSVVEEEPSEEHVLDHQRSPCPSNREPLHTDADDQGQETDTNFSDEDMLPDLGLPGHQSRRSEGSPLPRDPIASQISHDPRRPSQDSPSDSDSISLPPHLSPLRASPSAGNRGYANDKNWLHTLQNGESKSMRSRPVRPKSLKSRLPSTTQKRGPKSEVACHTSTDGARAVTGSVQVLSQTRQDDLRSSLDDALLPRRGAVHQDAQFDRKQAPEPTVHQHPQHDRGRQAELAPALLSYPEKAPNEVQPQEQNSALSHKPPPINVAKHIPIIAAKLAATEQDADAARLRAKIKAAQTSTRGVSRPVLPTATGPAVTATASEQAGDPVKQPLGQPDKRKRDRKASKTASRRRSTLSPQELETLIGGY